MYTEEYNKMNLNINQWVKTGISAVSDHAPALLTAFGAVGVVGTAVLTAKATFAAAEEIRTENEERAEEGGEFLTTFESAKLVWVHYVPAASTGALSVAAIVMSHRISSKRAAVLAAAYALNEKRLEEYQEKVKEKFGLKKEKEARDEINQDRVTTLWNNGDANDIFFNPLAGKVMIMEAYTGRPFWSTVENIKAAVNEVNHEIDLDNYVLLSQFYDRIGLPHVSTSDDFGWNSHERMELDWTTTTTPDGSIAVHVFDYVNPPIMKPGDARSFR